MPSITVTSHQTVTSEHSAVNPVSQSSLSQSVQAVTEEIARYDLELDASRHLEAKCERQVVSVIRELRSCFSDTAASGA